MPSFNDVLDALAVKITDYAALKTYCQTNFNRAHQVKRRFKKITTHLAELPEIQMVAPSSAKQFLIGARDGRHDVALFFIFREEDNEKAQTHLVALDELLDDCLDSFQPGDIGAREIEIDNSTNDAGMNHPVYIFASGLKIRHRR